MKRINLKEQFKKRMFKQLFEATTPPQPMVDPILQPVPGAPVYVPHPDPFHRMRDLISPSWRNPNSTNPWDNIPPSSPFYRFPRQLRDLFPKGPKQYQNFQTNSYNFIQTWQDILEMIEQWARENGLWDTRTDGAQNEQQVRLYLMNPEITNLINRLLYLFSALGENYGSQSTIMGYMVRHLAHFINWGGVGNAIPPWLIPGSAPYNDEQYDGLRRFSKPIYVDGNLLFQNPITFPNGILYITNPHPPGSPQWYQWDGDRYVPMNIPGFGQGGGVLSPGPSQSPIVPGYRNPRNPEGGAGGYGSGGQSWSQEYGGDDYNM